VPLPRVRETRQSHCTFLPRDATLMRYIGLYNCYGAVLVRVSVCPYICMSVTSSIRMAKYIIMQTTQHDSPGTLVLWCQGGCQMLKYK